MDKLIALAVICVLMFTATVSFGSVEKEVPKIAVEEYSINGLPDWVWELELYLERVTKELKKKFPERFSDEKER